MAPLSMLPDGILLSSLYEVYFLFAVQPLSMISLLFPSN